MRARAQPEEQHICPRSRVGGSPASLLHLPEAQRPPAVHKSLQSQQLLPNSRVSRARIAGPLRPLQLASGHSWSRELTELSHPARPPRVCHPTSSPELAEVTGERVKAWPKSLPRCPRAVPPWDESGGCERSEASRAFIHLPARHQA